ncbi:MAG TPA: TolC family protein [Candidatus Limnocylindria bacterium]|nr:TolC family protein [Candidatus Limnocylindria bacterium]
MSRSPMIALAVSAGIFAASIAPLGAMAQTTNAMPAANTQGLPPPPGPPVLPAVPNLPVTGAPSNVVPNGDLAGVKQQPFVGISLQDAVGMALQRNTDLALAQSNRVIANYQIVAAKGAYDVNYQLIPSYSHSVTPVINPFATNPQGGPVTQDTAGVTTGITGLTGTGGHYNVSLNASRTDSNNVYNSYNPYWETALQFSVTQPLSRGLATDQPRLQLQLSKLNNTIQSEAALAQASNVVVQVSDAYYNLVSAWQGVAIQEEALRQATAQAQSNTRLAARGAVAPTDIVEANAQVSTFQGNVFAAIQNVQRMQTQLKSLILGNPSDPVWVANLVPTTPAAAVPSEPTIDALVNTAIQQRPEIAEVRAQEQQAGDQLAFEKDQLKPQVDLGLGYTTNGFAGVPAPGNPLFSALASVPGINLSAFSLPPGFQSGNIGTAFKNGFENRFPLYTTQLTFSFPIGNHTAKANVAIAQEQQRGVAVNETALLERIRGEAVNAIQGLRSAQYQLIAARQAREASERVLLGEQRKFQAGTSTTFLVLQRQVEVANARGSEVAALTNLDQAIVELNRVSGGVFAQNGIDVNALGQTTLSGTPPTGVLPPAPGASPAPGVVPVPRRDSH